MVREGVDHVPFCRRDVSDSRRLNPLLEKHREALLSFLTVPYIRMPLVLAFFTTGDRVNSLFDQGLQQILQAERVGGRWCWGVFGFFPGFGLADAKGDGFPLQGSMKLLCTEGRFEGGTATSCPTTHGWVIRTGLPLSRHRPFSPEPPNPDHDPCGKPRETAAPERPLSRGLPPVDITSSTSTQHGKAAPQHVEAPPVRSSSEAVILEPGKLLEPMNWAAAPVTWTAGRSRRVGWRPRIRAEERREGSRSEEKAFFQRNYHRKDGTLH